MLLSRVLKVRYLTVVLLVLIVAASAYAFAAANVVPETGAGDGKKTISGYNVADGHSTIWTAPIRPRSTTVSFTLTPLVAGAPAPDVVKIKLVKPPAVPGMTAQLEWYTVVVRCRFCDRSQCG